MTTDQLLRQVALEMGLTLIEEPRWNKHYAIVFPNGGRFLLNQGNFTINYVPAKRIATDKDSADFFLRQAGFPVVPHSQIFFSKLYGESISETGRGIDEAYEYAKSLGWPVIVKPNDGSLGVGVALVHNKRQFYTSLREIFKRYRRALVQKPFYGHDYRLVVLGDEFITAYQRIPLSIQGDGRSTIRDLTLAKIEKLRLQDRHVSLDVEDKRIIHKLRRQGFEYSYIPEHDQQIFLLDNANLSAGGDSEDVSDLMHPRYKELAVEITKTMGLKFCGVDLLIAGDISEEPNEWCVLEVNGSPGLNHFMQSGPEQMAVVERLYTKALRMIEASFDIV